MRGWVSVGYVMLALDALEKEDLSVPHLPPPSLKLGDRHGKIFVRASRPREGGREGRASATLSGGVRFVSGDH